MTSSLPKTYTAAVVEKANDKLTFKELPLKEPGVGEILIKVVACGVCHSDEAVRTGVFGRPPVVPGHEMIGDVAVVGPGEKKWKIGDRVGGPWHGGHDGLCKSCNRGDFSTCEKEEVNGVWRDGGYAQYCLLRTEAAARIPAGLDAAAAAPMLCAGVTVFNAIRNMNVPAGATVAVQGIGGLGHLALQFSRKMGFRTVALSRGGAKRELALRLGATDYVDTGEEDAAKALSAMGGAALIVVTAPSAEVMGPLIEGCAARGKLLLLAAVGPVMVDTVPMIMKGLSVHGWPAGHAIDVEETIAFAQRQGVECMVERFPFSKAQEAMDYMMSGKVRFRAVITMEE